MLSFDYDGPSETVFVNNTAHRNGEEGFAIEGHGVQVIHNVADDNGEEGFQIGSDTVAAVLIGNSASRNHEEGFQCFQDSEDVLLQHNFARDNGEEGIQVDGQGHELMGNQSTNNQMSGIFVESTTQNITVRLNVVFWNGDGINHWDLRDAATDCGTTTWWSNVSGTRNQTCAQ